MLLELAKPVTLLASMISLLAVFHTAFLGPETDFRQRIYDSVGMLLLAAGISLIGGLVFQESGRGTAGGDGRGPCVSIVSNARIPRLIETFPVQVFCWTAGLMAILFVLAWYLETHFILYKDLRY